MGARDTVEALVVFISGVGAHKPFMGNTKSNTNALFEPPQGARHLGRNGSTFWYTIASN